MKEKAFKVRLSESEKELLERKSEQAGMSQSDIIRTILLAADPIEVRLCRKELENRTKTLNALKGEIRRIGVNLNQIAHNLNGGFFVWEDHNALIRMDRELHKLLEEVERGYNDDGSYHHG